MFVKSESSPTHRLDYTDSVTGWFHLQMQILVLLYRTHLGDSQDLCSLERWIGDLERNRNRLWDAQKDHVKNFRACEDLFETVLDGYVLASIIKTCGSNSPSGFLTHSAQSPETLAAAIEALAKHLATFTHGAIMQEQPSDRRDHATESMTLFMQQGLTMRNFKRAMHDGDSGRALASLSYYTIWFHGSSHHKYAMETMHLTACLTKYWSDEYIEFYMDNCLINPSGRPNAFMADDFFCEWMIGQAKSRIPYNLTSATLHFFSHTIVPQLMFFRECRLKMTAETAATTYGFHSTAVKRDVDIQVVCDAILEDGVGSFKAGRVAEGGETVDLFARGLEVLGSGERIANYKKQMEKDFNIRAARPHQFDPDNDGDDDDDVPNEADAGGRAEGESDDRANDVEDEGADGVEFEDMLNLADSDNDEHDGEWDDADEDIEEDLDEDEDDDQ